MPDESVIIEIENILSEVVQLGGQSERTKIVPNLLVTDASPSGLDGFVIVSDNRDGDNILAKTVGNVIYSDNDLVNVIFPEGGEAIAFQQGSQSVNSGIWEIVPATNTDIYYNKGDVGIGKSVAPDAALEILDTAQQQLRLTFQEDTKFADFTVDTNHDLAIDPSSTGQIKLASVDVTIEEDLIHEGDPDTKIALTADDVEIFAGGLSMLKLTEAGQDLITLGPGSGDVDIDFNGDMTLQGSDGKIAINTTVGRPRLHSKETVFDSVQNTAVLGTVDTTNDTTASYQSSALSATNNYRGTNANTAAKGIRAIEANMFVHNTNTTLRAMGFTLDSRNLGAGTVTHMHGSRVPTMLNSGGGTITNIYGHRVESQTVATNNYGFYQAGSGINVFEDEVKIGSAGAPSAPLHVDQSSTIGAQPVILLDQADLSEEFINFVSTIGAGNSIDTAAIGTYYGKVRVAVNGTFKYVALYNS